MLMLKKLFVSLVLCLSLIATPVIADELGLGGGYVTGHSSDNDYAINNDGWAIGAHFDKDMGWQKRFSENNAVGIDPGMAYFFLRWEKDVEKTKTKKWEYEKYDECLNCRDWLAPVDIPDPVYITTTEKYSETEWTNSHILAATLKPYWEIFKDFRLFGVGGAGYEFADDENNAFAVLTGGGLQFMVTESIGTSLSYNAIWSDPAGNDTRRFDVTMFSIDFRF